MNWIDIHREASRKANEETLDKYHIATFTIGSAAHDFWLESYDHWVKRLCRQEGLV